MPLLLNLNFDRSLVRESSQKSVLVDKTLTPMAGLNCNSGSGSDGYQSGFNGGGGVNDDLSGKENSNNFGMDSPADDKDGELPAVVVYLVDPFSYGGGGGSDAGGTETQRLSYLALMRCYLQILPHLKGPLKHNIYLQLVSVDSIAELSRPQTTPSMPSGLRGLAFSVYSQVQKPMQYSKDCKSLTGFGPASATERFFKANEARTEIVQNLYQPAFVLAPTPVKKTNSDAERSTSLFVNYCLSEDQHWLLATCCDEKGELVRTTVINVEIPNKTRRKKASARRVGLKKLMDWILSVMASALVPWRLVIGRIGRIGHGELRGERKSEFKLLFNS